MALSLPICDIVINYDDDHDLGAGWSCLPKNILQGYNNNNASTDTQPKSYIYYRRRLPKDKLVWNPKHLQLGDLLDAKDDQQDWCFATVIDTDVHLGIKVHYTRWTDQYDEWIGRDETRRLAEFGTKSTEETKITRGKGHEIQRSLIQAKIDRFTILLDNKNYEQIDEYLESQLNMFVSQCLGYSLNYDDLSDKQRCISKIVELLELIVKASVWQLSNMNRPPSTKLLELLKLTLLHDTTTTDSVNYFFEEHGHEDCDAEYLNASETEQDNIAIMLLTSNTGTEGGTVAPILEHSSHYIHLFNLFDKLGGLQMMLSR